MWLRRSALLCTLSLQALRCDLTGSCSPIWTRLGGIIGVAALPEPGCVQYGYGRCRNAAPGVKASGRGTMGSAGDWPLARRTYEQRERAARSGRRMAEAARSGAPSGTPSPHPPLGATCGGRGPGERRGGNQSAAIGAARRCRVALLRGASSGDADLWNKSHRC